MEIVLTLIFSLCLAGIVVGVLVPKVRPVALFSGCVLLYVVSCFAWWMALWLRVVSYDRLIAPVRWTEYERIVGAGLYLGVPLLPPLTLLLFFISRSYRRRRRSRAIS